MKVSINTSTLQLTFKDPNLDVILTKIAPVNLNQAWKGLDLTKECTVYAYGLGQQFITIGSVDGDWTGRQQLAGKTNAMTSFNAGANGNTRFLILYSKGSSAYYSLFLDQVYKNEWD